MEVAYLLTSRVFIFDFLGLCFQQGTKGFGVSVQGPLSILIGAKCLPFDYSAETLHTLGFLIIAIYTWYS